MLSFRKKDQSEPKIDLSVEKLSLTNTITIEALIQVLLKHNVFTQEELLEEIRKMQKHTTVLKDEIKDSGSVK
ncbi:MAG: hypothetical protein PHF33_04935 [Candidatus Delongbacteria bacterium]|jgi:hypothetical protein|nr:hypothetical protein [Candidatus Delongbacteria bacterium]MDD4204781.1 hypothetical protein [Candidatus Delongbacteria bacterium]MDY0017670.1 hypothetical protein [Candidatus Delongbacteria bacterium]